MYTNTYGDLHVDWVTAPPPLILIEEVALNKKDFATTNEE